MTLDEFYAARLVVKQAALTSLEEAYLALSTGGVQSYTLNTGQTTQQVTKHNIASIGAQISKLEGEIVELLNKVNGAGRVAIATPGF